VAAAARRVAGAVRAIGVSASTADIPGREAEQRFAPGTVELGLGIHGEPGVETFELGPAGALVERMAAALLPPPNGPAAADGPAAPLAIMVNRLGGLAPLEAAVVTREVLASSLGQRARLLVGPAPLMTSLSMCGFSLSVLECDDELLEALRAPTADWAARPGVRELDPERPTERVTVWATPELPGTRPVKVGAARGRSGGRRPRRHRGCGGHRRDDHGRRRPGRVRRAGAPGRRDRPRGPRGGRRLRRWVLWSRGRVVVGAWR
jgi:hypothetical protein